MKTVLTVDDSRVVRTIVARSLSALGCAVIEAADGRAGLDAARRHRPDLVLLDVSMPVMDGRRALAELRADLTTKEIPVVVLTDEHDRDVLAEMAALGVSGHLVKPFRIEELEHEVVKVVGRPGAER